MGRARSPSPMAMTTPARGSTTCSRGVASTPSRAATAGTTETMPVGFPLALALNLALNLALSLTLTSPRPPPNATLTPTLIKVETRTVRARKGPLRDGTSASSLRTSGTARAASTKRTQRRAASPLGRASDTALPKCSGSERPMQPLTAPEAHLLARGCPLGPRGAPLPPGCQREAGRHSALWCLLEVVDSTAIDRPGGGRARSTRQRLPRRRLGSPRASRRSKLPAAVTSCARARTRHRATSQS